MKPTPFAVNSEERDGVLVIAVSGELDLNTTPRLEEPLGPAVSAAAAPVAVDLSDCEFIDSTGIAQIVRAWHALGAEGGPGFALCCVGDQVQRLLRITGLESLIPIHSSVDEALAKLRG